jgi:hypothetical protein
VIRLAYPGEDSEAGLPPHLLRDGGQVVSDLPVATLFGSGNSIEDQHAAISGAYLGHTLIWDAGCGDRTLR